MSDQYQQHADEMIPVRVVSTPAPRRQVWRSVYKTVTLTAAKDAAELLPASDSRVCAYIRPLDDDVVVCGNKSDAAAGEGTVIAKTLTAPWPIQDSAPVWVAAQALTGATSRIAVTDTYCTYE